ncbi:hypothetical protein L484_021609 [Morus notabilis]|uniref:Uncharacterized protein n=1 Tax=Morus notabilis TaxID=981085 RepID=W9S5X6_9ROSA|nr:hypothetical protein L484_021609 [Morus notabilis]
MIFQAVVHVAREGRSSEMVHALGGGSVTVQNRFEFQFDVLDPLRRFGLTGHRSDHEDVVCNA